MFAEVQTGHFLIRLDPESHGFIQDPEEGNS